MRGVVVGLALAGLPATSALALSAAPAAAATFRGESTQSLPVLVKTRTDGRARRFEWAWQAGCRSGGTFRGATHTRRLRQTRHHGFVSHGSYVVDRSGFRFSISGIVGGEPVSASEWRGSFRLSVVVHRRGKVIDRCLLGTTRWQAIAPSAPDPM